MNSLSRTQRTIIGIGTGVAMFAASFAPIGVSGLQAAGLPAAGNSIPVSVTGTVNFTSVPTVSISPSSAAPGETFTVTGSGFTPGDTVTIEFGGDTIGTAKVGEDGTFSTTATVPDHMPVGEHPLDVNGMEGVSKDRDYTVTMAPPPPAPTPQPTPRAPYYVPRVSSTPGSAAAGDTVTFTGKGFRPGELVTISFGGSDIAVVQADGLGEFTTSGRVPDGMPIGDHPLDANGDLGSSWDGDLGVSAPRTPPPAPSTPKVGMAPGAAEAGQYVVFSGHDFYAGEHVSIDFGGSIIATATADAVGAFSASGMIAANMPVGSHPLDANGDKGSSWDGTLTVLTSSTPPPRSTPAPTATPRPANTPAPTVTTQAPTPAASAPAAQARVQVSPGSAAPGERLSFTGTGFVAGERVRVEFGGTTLATVIASAAGEIRASGWVPDRMPAGAHPMAVTGDRGSSVEGAFTVKVATTTTATTATATTSPSTSGATANTPATEPASNSPTASTASSSAPALRTAATTATASRQASTGSTPATASDATNGESMLVLAGPEQPQQPVAATAKQPATESTTASDSSGDQQPVSGDRAEVATSQSGNSQLILALLAMAGAMPVLAGAGWVLGTRRNRQAAPRRRTW